MQVPLIISDRDRGARDHRRAQAAALEFLVAPNLRAITLTQRHDRAIGFGDVQIIRIDRQPSIARHIVRPPQLARVKREHRRTTLETGGEDIVADHTNGRVNVDQPIQFRAAVRRCQDRVPNRVAGGQRDRHHLAVVEAADRDFLGDSGCGCAAQAQPRHLLLNRPQHFAGVRIKAVQAPVHRSHHDDFLADRRGGQQL